MPTATYVAAAINAVVAWLSYRLSTRTRYGPTPPADSPANPAAPAAQGSVYVAIGLSGLTALGAEVVWTRLLSVMLGATVYTFSIILAVFLIGLGLGSGLASHLARQIDASAHRARRLPDPARRRDRVDRLHAGRRAAQLADQSAAGQERRVQLSDRHHALHVGDLSRRLPVGRELSRSRWPPPRRAVRIPERWSARVYAANTVGGILGALAFSIILIPWIGTQDSPAPADRARRRVGSDRLRARSRDRSANTVSRRPSHQWSPLSG